ncbi:MAG TPA: ATP-binding cassette domain-containing protein [Propionibacteriaceae bacterium]|nr:ATP-binding cassette domain-containing protein [Propionibacteriaceae bacterium]
MTEEEKGTVGLGNPPVLANPSETVLSARGLIKTFGKVVGLDGVDLDLFPGEVLAVIGDNGAGKSTLIKAMTGALIPDSGQVFLDGNEVHFKTPQDARSSGIETVYQTLAVAPALDIAANMFLGREQRRSGPLGSVLRMLDKKGMKEAAGTSMANLGIATVQNMSQAVETLSGGQRQAVAVARAVMWSRTSVLMDEPTAALGARQSAIVCELMRTVASRGLGVLVVSHDLPRVLKVADRVSVLWRGRTALEEPAGNLTVPDVVAAMVGYNAEAS